MLSAKCLRLAFLYTLILSCASAYAVSDGSDNVCLPNGNCYFPVDSGSFFGSGASGGLVEMTSTSSVNGTVTVQEKNLCPIGYQGGQLYGLQRYDLGIRPVIQINGAPYLQWYFPTGFPSIPGVRVSYGPSDDLNVPFGPIPEIFPLVTITGLQSTSAYAFISGQVCYYRTCSCAAPSGCGCEFNAAFSELLINNPTTNTPPSCNPTLALTLSNPAVGPAKTSISNSTVVTAHLINASNSADCVGGKTIQFTSQAQELSGGHNHSGGRPTGTFTQPSCATGPDGTCSVTYAASEVGGVEQITAALTGNPPQQASTMLNVQVPSLVNFEDLSGILNGTILRFSAGGSAHPQSHFIKPGNAANIFGIANGIFDLYQATVGLNDMSLPQGGLFDIGPPKYTFWSRPHNLHREGNSVDIDHCALSLISNNPNSRGDCPAGWVSISRRRLINLCDNNNGTLVNEASFHCEFQ